MENKKVYYIPPKLDRNYQYAGFKVWELLAFLVMLFGAGYLILYAGWPPMLIGFPAAYLVLHCRTSLFNGYNVQQLLAIRWRYFGKDQRYSLQECDRRR